MKCPLCESKATVISTRDFDKFITRRQICNNCGVRFTSHETVTHVGNKRAGLDSKHMEVIRALANRWGNKEETK